MLPPPPPPPPDNPQDKYSPSGPGTGKCLKQSCPGGAGVDKIESNFSLFKSTAGF